MLINSRTKSDFFFYYDILLVKHSLEQGVLLYVYTRFCMSLFSQAEVKQTALLSQNLILPSYAKRSVHHRYRRGRREEVPSS